MGGSPYPVAGQVDSAVGAGDDALFGEAAFLFGGASKAIVAAQAAIGADYAVAGYGYGVGIGMYRIADGSGGPGTACHRGYLRVGGDIPSRNRGYGRVNP